MPKTRVYPEKYASLGGQDLRSPMLGGTKLPTEDSKGPAASSLRRSSAEVGPNPSAQTIKPPGQTLHDVSVKMPSTKGMLPKVAMRQIDEAVHNDPLMAYMRKHAEELLTNVEKMPDPYQYDPPEERVEHPEEMPVEGRHALQSQDDVLEMLFNNYKA